MVTITKLEFKGRYRIIWLRYVSGVNLAEHCMKSLLGYNDKRVRGYNHQYFNLLLPEAKYYYICGVDDNWNYNKNVHIAFRHMEGSTIVINDKYVSCEIQNAILVPINNTSINWKLPQSHNRLFNTCRNWWFANSLAREFSIPTQGRLF